MSHVMRIKDEHGNWIPILTIKGEPGGKGDTGDKGDKGDTGSKGDTGLTGNGIASVTLISGTHAAGTSDTYRITYTNAGTYDFLVYNGADGQGAGDMLASVYAESPGVVKDSAKLGAQPPAYYAKASDIPDALSDLSDDATHRLVTDAEKSTWNAKQSALSGDVSGHYHTADRSRANHTGTQAASTISDFAATVRAVVLTGLSTATNAAITAADSILVALGKLQAQITGHVGSSSNPHGVTAAQVGADASGTAASAVSTHNTDSGAHSSLFSAKQNTMTAGTDYAIPAVDITATLSTTWTGSAAPYTQSVDIAGMTAAKKIQVGLAASCTADQYAAAEKAKLLCTAQSAGAITITAFGTKPTAAIPILVRVVG